MWLRIVFDWFIESGDTPQSRRTAFKSQQRFQPFNLQRSSFVGLSYGRIHLASHILFCFVSSYGIKNDVDFVAASFVRKADDVRAIRSFIAETHGKLWPEDHPPARIISKIENLGESVLRVLQLRTTSVAPPITFVFFYFPSVTEAVNVTHGVRNTVRLRPHPAASDLENITQVAERVPS